MSNDDSEPEHIARATDPKETDQELATETVVETEDKRDKRKALVIFLAFVAAVILLILLVLFLLRMIGGTGGQYCPGTDLGNKVNRGADSSCDQSVTVG